MSKIATLVVFASLIASGVGHAGELALTFSGTALDGGPAFEVRVDKAVLGTGVVDPVPASGQGYEYSFAVPEGARDVSVRLTNDMFKAHGEDRNLFLLAASLDGTAIPLTSFALTRKGEAFTRTLIHGHIELWSNQEVATASLGAPAAMGQDIATASTPQTSQGDEAAIAPTPVAPTPAIATPAAVCTATAAVVGIQTASRPLNKSQLAVLAKVMSQAAGGKCAIALTGYASQGGSKDTNQRVSLARAKLVLETLKSHGLAFASEDVVGAGATNKFGDDDASNQRVSVALRALDKP